jgi:Clp amino terminal domain, pathogenicity island component
VGSAVAWFLFSLAIGPALVLVHELGHAAAVVLLTGQRTLVIVGDGDRYAGLRFGRVRIRLFGNDNGGWCEMPPNVSPRDWFVVGLAGPFASLLAAIGLVAAFLAFGGSVGQRVILALSALLAVLTVIVNLLPHSDGEQTSDGWYVREAWRRWYGTPDWRAPIAVIQERERRESTVYRLMTRAVGEAEMLDAPYVGTEHLLLALAGADDEVGEVLRDAGLTPEALRGAVGHQRAPAPTQLRNTPALLRALGAAAARQKSHGDDELTPRHFLEALLLDRDGQARRLVERLGSSATALHTALLERRVSSHASA